MNTYTRRLEEKVRKLEMQVRENKSLREENRMLTETVKELQKEESFQYAKRLA